eukprot:GILJ01003229.1.p1 GENE.GILJ01003229.1~~GILJ01003229.1.p1  ORF type:complete len:325 (-),score=20.76 GILJ01003229.1:290-1264(-)
MALGNMKTKLLRADMFKKKVEDENTATKLGVTLTVLSPLVFIGYSVWLIIAWYTARIVTTTYVASASENDIAFPLTVVCRVPAGCYLSVNLHTKSYSPACSNGATDFSALAIGCHQLAYLESYTFYTCYNPDPIDGISISWQAGQTIPAGSDPLSIFPANFGSSFNSEYMNSTGDWIIKGVPMFHGQHVMSFTYFQDYTQSPAVFHYQWSNTVLSWGPQPASYSGTTASTCYSSFGPLFGQEATFYESRIQIQPTYISTVISEEDWIGLFGQIGGAWSLIVYIFSVVVSAYTFAHSMCKYYRRRKRVRQFTNPSDLQLTSKYDV